MIYGLLLTAFIAVCLFLILIILVQKGKGSAGLGALGGGTQMLFGGSGGQDLFQKMTWVFGAIFMTGSLILVLMRSNSMELATPQPMRAPINQSAPVQPAPVEAPVEQAS